MEQDNRISYELLKKVYTFVNSCLNTRVYKNNGKINIITDKETLDVLKEIKKMIGDGYEG